MIPPPQYLEGVGGSHRIEAKKGEMRTGFRPDTSGWKGFDSFRPNRGRKGIRIETGEKEKRSPELSLSSEKIEKAFLTWLQKKEGGSFGARRDGEKSASHGVAKEKKKGSMSYFLSLKGKGRL